MTETDLQIGELTFNRIFDAPRDLVFRCMTEPEHLAHFWGPVGVSTPLENITVDLRPGAHDAAEVEERISQREMNAFRQRVVDAQVELGRHGEAVARMVPAVARQREHV